MYVSVYDCMDVYVCCICIKLRVCVYVCMDAIQDTCMCIQVGMCACIYVNDIYFFQRHTKQNNWKKTWPARQRKMEKDCFGTLQQNALGTLETGNPR